MYILWATHATLEGQYCCCEELWIITEVRTVVILSLVLSL
jgi:hypothetical protein